MIDMAAVNWATHHIASHCLGIGRCGHCQEPTRIAMGNRRHYTWCPCQPLSDPRMTIDFLEMYFGEKVEKMFQRHPDFMAHVAMSMILEKQ
jgi:hypothetical protein